MKILVTGSEGFIAKALIKKLDPVQNEITCWDIKNDDSFDYTKKYDLIYHLGAKTGARGTDYLSYEYFNVSKSIEIADYAKFHNSKVIYASSSSAKIPTNFYGLTKKWNEDMFKMLLPSSVGLRFFTVYGPNMRKDMFIYKAIEAIKNDQPVEIYGDYEREFTYIDDIVDCLISAKDMNGGVYDCSSGQKINITNACIMIAEILNKALKLKLFDTKDAYLMQSYFSIVKNPTPFIIGIKRTIESWQ